MRMLELRELGPLIKVEKRLNVKKIQEGCKGEHYYSRMEQWFIDDMSKLVRSPQGFTVYGDEYNLWFNGEDMIWFFVLRFDKKTGKYLGPKDITIKRRAKGSPIVVRYEYKDFRTKELNKLIQKFVYNATQLGYLI